MKTLDLIKFGKGYYVNARYNGHTVINEFHKTAKDANARVKELKAEGWVLSK